ncbi:MAG: hydrogenase maturation protease [Anaerolineae bacterium]|jgi:hydrogenase maturation protease|nr:hydrogenase maturation protease [Anaerolineae bacterium]MBT3712621.1 hydrogenase maturation protease [Anaerolineae bacterium]MBT4312316.1 hydrogenase maturation protease [Anaerolineae bacterium]MBT4457370.1 hydrogenase maturation protease [Anaerolineae bacterium]MBT4842913.1 hydrogenase maturation protease [Anaerolineae bacterium]
MKTLVVGLGNPILSDDGVGVKVAYAVEEALSPNIPENLTITEASVGGLRLMELLVGYDRVILIDAIMTEGHDYGHIHELTLDDLREITPTEHSTSAHDTSLVTALDSGIALGLHMPTEFEIIAVEVENIMDFSDEPTPAVAAAIPIVTEMVLNALRKEEITN